MRALLPILMWSALGWSGCADDKKQPTAPPPASAPADQAPTAVEPEPAPAAPTATPDAPADAAPAGDDECVARCVARNQMRAVGPEQIEADCRAECSE